MTKKFMAIFALAERLPTSATLACQFRQTLNANILPGPNLEHSECQFLVETIDSINEDENQYLCLVLSDNR